MNASIVDLRYKTKEILQAIDRNEIVSVSYHGKLKAKIIPVHSSDTDKKVTSHPFFGMFSDSLETPLETLSKLRGNRYDL